MPFASDKQRRYLWSQKPEVAKKFAEHKSHGGPMESPMHIKKVTEKDRYGNTMSYEFEVPEKGIDQTALMKHQMDMAKDMMGDVPQMMTPDHPGEPMGSDTVPAWLTPGEFVVNAEAMRIPGAAEKVEEINDMGREIQAMQGGSIPHAYASGGSVKQKAHDLLDKMDPASIARMMAELGNLYTQAQPVLGFDNGGSVPTPVPAPWTQRPAGTEELLHEREGYVPEIYLDSLGKPTVGYGHLIEDKVWDKNDPRVGTQPYSEAELKAFFDKDVAAAQSGAVRNIGRETWANLNPEQQKVLTSMAFQLGETGQKKFGNMIKAIQAGDYDTAAREALTGSKPGTKSKWLKQTPKRAFDLANAFSPSVAAQYKAAGGAIYLDDGGWGSWLKGKLGVPTASEISYPEGSDQGAIDAALQAGVDPELIAANPDIFAADVEEIPEVMSVTDDGWTPPPAVAAEPAAPMPTPHSSYATPITNDELQQAEVWEQQYADRDPDDLGMAIPSEDSSEVPEIEGYEGIGDWFNQEVLGPQGREVFGTELPDEIKDKALGREEAIARGAIPNPGSNNPQYQEYLRRAPLVGEIPVDYKTWKEQQTSGAAERHAILSNAPGAEAQREELAANKATAELDSQDVGSMDAAAAAARDAVRNGATVDEAASVGKEAGETPPVTKEPGSNPETDPEVGGDGSGAVDDALNNANKKERDKVQNEARSIFKDLGLDSLFDKKELARMAVMYAGSRLLGYDHGGSLQWAAKQYVSRVDAKEQGYSQLALSGKYTPQSLQNFKKSGDYADLMPVGATPELTGEFKTFFGPNGKQQRAQKVKVGDQTIWQTADGRTVDQTWSEDASVVPGTPEYGKRIKEDTKLYSGMIEDLRKTFGTTPGGRDQPDTYATELAPNVAGGKISKWAIDNKVPPEYMGSIIENAYHSAIEHGKATGEKVRDLTPFLEEQYVVAQVGDSTLFQGISGTNVSKLFSSVDRAYGGKYSTAQAMQVYRGAWDKLGPEKQKHYNDRAGKEQNGFMLFVQEDVNNKLAG